MNWSPFPSPDIATVATGQVPRAGLTPTRMAASIAALPPPPSPKSLVLLRIGWISGAKYSRIRTYARLFGAGRACRRAEESKIENEHDPSQVESPSWRWG